jgi:hypothetical protein
MRYCDKCGCAIASGGHKSACQGLFSSPYLCDECYATETENFMAAGKAAAKGTGCLARVFVGILSGLGVTVGVFSILSKVAGSLSDNVQMKIAIGVEVFAVVCFIASKIGTRILKSKFLRFTCSVIAYFSFWMALVFGIGMYFILKYA